MARTPAEIDAMPDYTSAQMAKLWRNLIAELGSSPEGQVIGPNGRAFTMQNLAMAQNMLAHWEAKAAQDLDNADPRQGSPVVRYQQEGGE